MHSSNNTAADAADAADDWVVVDEAEAQVSPATSSRASFASFLEQRGGGAGDEGKGVAGKSVEKVAGKGPVRKEPVGLFTEYMRVYCADHEDHVFEPKRQMEHGKTGGFMVDSTAEDAATAAAAAAAGGEGEGETKGDNADGCSSTFSVQVTGGAGGTEVLSMRFEDDGGPKKEVLMRFEQDLHVTVEQACRVAMTEAGKQRDATTYSVQHCAPIKAWWAYEGDKSLRASVPRRMQAWGLTAAGTRGRGKNASVSSGNVVLDNALKVSADVRTSEWEVR